MKNSGSLIFILLFLFFGIDQGLAQTEADQNETAHDPFHLPQKKVLNHPAPGGVQVGQWHLTGIIVGISGEKLAILNDRLVSEGEQVMGGTVQRIESDYIILKGTFGTKELRILPFLSEGQSTE